MKRILPLLSLLLLFHFTALSQGLPCGNGRFVSTTFTSSTKTADILYGRNTTFNGVVKDLKMDIFEPTGDVAAIRPLFIFAFGGAFVSGDRSQLAPLCDSMAKKGYVTVAIDYRLYDNPAGVIGLLFNPTDGIDAVAKGMSDIKAVIRYFKRDASTTKTYRIDTSNIYVGGISSGSMVALHTAYINDLSETLPPVSTMITNNGGMEGNTDLPGTPLIGLYTSKGIKGVWNMSGALYDSNYIKAGDPALFGIHGTADDVVPFGYGRIFSGQAPGLGTLVCGSSSLNNRAKIVNVQSLFFPIVGGDHQTMYFDTATLMLLDTAAPRYFGNIICPGSLPATGITLSGIVANKRVELSWQTASETSSKRFAIEKNIQNNWVTLAELPSKAANGVSTQPLSYNFNDLLPQEGSNTYRIRLVAFNGELSYSNTIYINWLLKPSFVWYPNPVSSILHVQTSSSGSTKQLLKIYSSDMRLVQTANIGSNNAISVGALKNGLYHAIIVDAKGQQVNNTWFIKQ